MKKIILLILIISIISCSNSNLNSGKSNKVSFITTIEMEKATKDGIYLNGYVVQIDFDEIEKLDGKKVEITGEMEIIEGIISDQNSTEDELIKQGRTQDTKYIKSPSIKLLDD